jgi:hypothetical protein
MVVIAEEKVLVEENSVKKIDLLYFTYYNDLSNKNCGFEESPFLQKKAMECSRINNSLNGGCHGSCKEKNNY